MHKMSDWPFQLRLPQITPCSYFLKFSDKSSRSTFNFLERIHLPLEKQALLLSKLPTFQLKKAPLPSKTFCLLQKYSKLCWCTKNSKFTFLYEQFLEQSSYEFRLSLRRARLKAELCYLQSFLQNNSFTLWSYVHLEKQAWLPLKTTFRVLLPVITDKTLRFKNI